MGWGGMHLICALLLPAPDVVCNSRQSPSIILIVDVIYEAIFGTLNRNIYTEK